MLKFKSKVSKWVSLLEKVLGKVFFQITQSCKRSGVLGIL